MKKYNAASKIRGLLVVASLAMLMPTDAKAALSVNPQQQNFMNTLTQKGEAARAIVEAGLKSLAESNIASTLMGSLRGIDMQQTLGSALTKISTAEVGYVAEPFSVKGAAKAFNKSLKRRAPFGLGTKEIAVLAAAAFAVTYLLTNLWQAAEQDELHLGDPDPEDEADLVAQSNAQPVTQQETLLQASTAQPETLAQKTRRMAIQGKIGRGGYTDEEAQAAAVAQGQAADAVERGSGQGGLKKINQKRWKTEAQ